VPRRAGTSQSFKPRQAGCIRSPQRRSTILGMVDRLGLLDGFSLHFEICGGIAVGCGDTGVAEPLADREDVHPGSQQMYRSAVAHAVGVETFVRQCRSHRVSSCTVFPEERVAASEGARQALSQSAFSQTRDYSRHATKWSGRTSSLTPNWSGCCGPLARCPTHQRLLSAAKPTFGDRAPLHNRPSARGVGPAHIHIGRL